MASELTVSVARRDRLDPDATRLNREGEVRLRASRPMVELLDQLSARLNTPVDDLLTQAVVLSKVAIDAQARDQRVCLLDDDLNIMGEIVDFGTSEGKSGKAS